VTTEGPNSPLYEVLRRLQAAADRPDEYDRALMSPDHPNVTAYVDAYLASADYMTPKEKKEYRKGTLEYLRSVADLELPTSYEDWRTYALLTLASREIESVIQRLGLQMPSKPLLGTVWSHEINGQYLVVRDDQTGTASPLIIIESGLFTYFRYILESAIRTLRAVLLAAEDVLPDDTGFVNVTVAPDDDFCRALGGYVRALSPNDAGIIFKTHESLDPMSARLEDGTILFLVGHEYGHLLGQHERELGKDQDSEFLASSMEWELEADRSALVLALGSYLDTDDVAFGAVGFLSVAATLEHLNEASMDQGSVNPSGTHPPAQVRRTRLYEHLRTLVDDQQASDIVGMAEILASILTNSGFQPVQDWPSRA